jgi:glycosyltransferase involved in cell wall biosynthesis
MTDTVAARTSICLNMIVLNEAHVVREVLDSVAPFITSWVIVDTGSSDGTQELIRSHLADLGIPGELHERPWLNFGHNRSEALSLAKGFGDYIWVIDADDVVVGTPDFRGLTADVCSLRFGEGAGVTYWRWQLFRDEVPWRYEGLVHEYAACDRPFTEARIDGDYYVDSRRLGARSLDPQKYARDRDLLLPEVERNPDDARSVFYLAQSYRDLGDTVNARKWYARRADIADDWDEERYCAMYEAAQAMSRLDEPWPDVQDAYLRAWDFRPTRAEPLYAIAFHYRSHERYRLGHLFAERAAEIPFPKEDSLFVTADVYAWRAIDEQAVCASWLDKPAEAFTLCRRNLARDDISDDERKRIAGNRDVAVPAMIEAAVTHPQELAQQLRAGARNADVTVTLTAGPDRAVTEATLNSFLNCCNDISRISRFVVINNDLSAEDRATLLQRYRFLEFHDVAADAQWSEIREVVQQRFWLHLGEGWRFFAPDEWVGRLIGVLDAEPDVYQVGVNVGDATGLTGVCATEDMVRRAADAGRYVLTDVVASGPAMFDTARMERAGGLNGTDSYPLAALHQRAATAGMRTASLDEVLCIAAR